MAFSFQDIVNRARVPLNDAAKTRFPDSELLIYAHDAYLTFRRYRADLFIGTYEALPSISSLTLTSNFPAVGDEYLPTIADYVTARAEFKDDESVINQRAALFAQIVSAGMRTP